MAKKPYPSDADQAQRAEYAVRFLIDHHTAKYAHAVELFDVSFHAIRSRIEYRFGTLAEARAQNGKNPVQRRKKITRKRRCLICREPTRLELHRYICDPCSRQLEREHDGWV